jgi:hypothetical protein
MTLRGMIHLSERERMDTLAASAAAANSRASMADAPPPIMASLLPLASFLLQSQKGRLQVT